MKPKGKWFKTVALVFMGLCLLAPDNSPAVDSFSKPYIMQDRALGKGKPGFTFNDSGLLPNWFSFSLQHRTRYESLNNQFRKSATGSDQLLSLRTLAQATLRLHSNFNLQLELQDSRTKLADSGTPLNTSIVNTLELLEANLRWSRQNLFQKGSQSLLRGGRLTMDIGKRRLVARNRFRNTKNSFTGFDWIWESKNKNTVRTFFTLPVNRQPNTSAQLLQNNASFDEETWDRIFWGVFLATPELTCDIHAELYLFGLHEDDSPNFATRNRDLFTPGFRLYRPNSKGHFDLEWESIFQFGTSRATTSINDTSDLDHFAHFHHVELGYTFATSWSPRFVIAYDYASGDARPNDGKNGRFDSLFGATVFEYGPTSIHRAFVRTNINGPGIELALKPHRNVLASIHYRGFWLSSDTDMWAGNSDLRDVSGNSGSFLGQQIFIRGKWQALPNVALEGGVAYRIDGDFQNTAPNAPRQGDTVYSYASATLSF